MRIGFYLGRETHLKTLGSLIQQSISQHYNVKLFYRQPQGLGGKSYQGVKPDALAVFGLPASEVIGVNDFSQLLSLVPCPDILIVHEGFHTLNKDLDYVTELRERGTRIVSIMHFFEAAQHPLMALDLFDLTIYPSDFGRDLHFKLQCAKEESVREKESRRHQYVVAGEPMFDQIEEISRQEARKELNIPSSARVVLFIAPVISLVTPWRFHVWAREDKLSQTRDVLRIGKPQYVYEIWTGHRFDHIVKAIRRFCDRNSAMLIVKSRGKQKIRPNLQQSADLFLDGFEDVYFPVFTTYKLMAAADLCFTVNSMAAVEAVVSGIPCVNIYVPHLDLAESLDRVKGEYLEILLNGKPNSLMNYPGCISNVDRRNFLNWLDGTMLSDFRVDRRSQEKYKRRFLGMGDLSASERILNVLATKFMGKSGEHGGI